MASTAEENTEKAVKIVEYHCPFKFSGPTVDINGYRYRLTTKADCFRFRQFVDTVDGFTVDAYEVNKYVVWSKSVPHEPMKIIKGIGFFKSTEESPISCELLYDMIHDPVYRLVWDKHRLDAFSLTKPNEYTELGYYAAKAPSSFLSPRDFVTQRQWYPTGREEYVIFNTSVPHSSIPEDYQTTVKKSKEGTFVRAISKVTGYFIQPWKDRKTGKTLGVCLTYVTQADPCGMIPSYLTNFVMKKVVPTSLATLEDSMRKYAAWRDKKIAKGTYHKDWVSKEEWWSEGNDVTGGVTVENLTLNFSLDLFEKRKP